MPSGAAGSLLAAGSGLALRQPRAVRAGGRAGLRGLRLAGVAQGLDPRGVLMPAVRLARPAPVSVPAGSPGGRGTGVALALGPETGSWAPVPRGSLEGKRVGG